MNRPQLLRFLAIQEGILLLLAFAIANWRHLALWHGWSLSPRAWGIVALSTLALVVINGLVWVTSEHLRVAITELFQLVFASLHLPDLVLVSLLSGISEEIAFRGVLQPLVGLTVSSFLFALLHVPSRNLWVYGLWALFASLYLGNLYVWTGNLFVPIGVHVLNNLVSLLIWHRSQKGRSPAA